VVFRRKNRLKHRVGMNQKDCYKSNPKGF